MKFIKRKKEFLIFHKFKLFSKIQRNITITTPRRQDKFYILPACENSSELINNVQILNHFNYLRGKCLIEDKNVESLYKEEATNSFFQFLNSSNMIHKHNNKFYLEPIHLNVNSLYNDLNVLKNFWPTEIISHQYNLLNKQTDVKIKFTLINEITNQSYLFDVFIDRPEYIFGVAFITIKNSSNIGVDLFNSIQYKKESNKNQSENQSKATIVPKIYAINPINDEKIPIVIINYDIFNHNADYDYIGHVPGHDHISHKLAEDLNLRVKYVAKSLDKMSESLIDNNKPVTKDVSFRNIKEELKRMNQPVILNEGFLINSKHFDYLYLSEAKDLLVNNLIKKGKAIRNEKFLFKEWHIATEISNSINYTETFSKACMYLNKCMNMNMKYNLEDPNFVLNFKKLLPVDILIYEECNNSQKEMIFYSRIIHNLILNTFRKELPIKSDDDVYIDKESELEKDILFPAPFKTIVKSIRAENLNLDVITINKLNVIHEDILYKIKHFELEKLLDEKLNLNDENSQIVYKIYSKIINFYEILIQGDISSGIKSLNGIIELIHDNSEIFVKYPNFYVYIYLNALMLLYPFNMNKSVSLYNELYTRINCLPLPSSLDLYSIEKLNQTCHFFIDMLRNSVRVDLYINGEYKNKIILDRNLVNEKKKNQILKLIREEYSIEIIEDDSSIEFDEINENKIVLKSI